MENFIAKKDKKRQIIIILNIISFGIVLVLGALYINRINEEEGTLSKIFIPIAYGCYSFAFIHGIIKLIAILRYPNILIVLEENKLKLFTSDELLIKDIESIITKLYEETRKSTTGTLTIIMKDGKEFIVKYVADVMEVADKIREIQKNQDEKEDDLEF
ncbi:MAG: hypothetical protein WCR54_02380 [Clostridia bacterium]